MPIEGFELQANGPQSGLFWVTFSQYNLDGKRGTPAYVDSCVKKAAFVDRVILTELRLGTKHYDSKGKLLKTHAAILHSYRLHGGYFADLSNRPKWKMDAYIKNEGIIHHDQRAADPH